MQPDDTAAAYDNLRRKVIEDLRDPLLMAIEREWSRYILRENIILSRVLYKRLKWDVVKTIINGDE